MSISVVIATNREDSIKRWLDAWLTDLQNTEVIIVQDTPTLGDMNYSTQSFRYKNLKRYSWQEIDEDLGNSSWIIPRKTSAIKSYGFLKATGDIIWTLDDDCFPEQPYHMAISRGYLRNIEDLFLDTYDSTPWFNTLGGSMFPRGFPYEGVRDRKPLGIWHGLWSGIPDLDGITSQKFPEYRTRARHGYDVVPYGKLFPMCGMNLAFHRDLLPCMYFMLQGHMRHPDGEMKKLPFDRFDDIWAGLFAKKVADSAGYAVISGGPSIVHTKESVLEERIRKEAPGIEVNEELWKILDRAYVDPKDSIAQAYHVLTWSAAYIQYMPNFRKYRSYFNMLHSAAVIWTDLVCQD